MGNGASDSGQAFPVYITVIAALLFLAFVYFAVGQAASTRNGAQTAADSAALAAAQDAREQLRIGWLEVIADPTQWGPFLDGEQYVDALACGRAAEFAARNGAELPPGGCERLLSGGEGFKVTVRTTGTVGRSLVPGTESQHAAASAEAVIEPRCTFDEPEPTAEPAPPEPTDEPPPTEPTQEPTPTDPPEKEPIVGLVCGDEAWDIDPENPALPDAVDLFSVRLSD
ncbi:pilus assembly protein TadG-related protein [Streptomyces sp. NPDC017254]|uniref:pilus assembly protein TadG-related protein n=1 Tax=unclassified Streptomyces TaxID=2593676 RepID=UPI0037A9E8DB